MIEYEKLPFSVQTAGDEMLSKLRSARTCGTTDLVDGWSIETHTLGCRYEAGTPEEDWWDEHYIIYDEYLADGISVVDGDPTEGIFITFTPARKRNLSESVSDWKTRAAKLFPEEYKEFRSLVGRRPDGVEYTTIENDVKRRDLTINALFYDIAKHEIVDFVGGIADIENGVVKSVGRAADRFEEDRLRILRALRFAARMGAGLDEETETAIQNDNSLAGVSPERIRDEFLKSIKSAQSVPDFLRLYDNFDLWGQVFPDLKVSSWYKDTKNVPVLLSLLLRENNPSALGKKLNKLKYSVVEARQIVFLTMFQNLTPENAFELKKLWKSTRLSDSDLEEFAHLSSKPDMRLVKAFNEYTPSVDGQDLLAQGFTGRGIGQEMNRLETELFQKLL